MSWERALDYTAERLRAIRDKHGPDAIAGVGSARDTNENAYAVQKFLRAVVGTNSWQARETRKISAARTMIRFFMEPPLSNQFFQFLFPNDLHAQTSCFLQLGAWVFTQHQITRLLADRIRHLAAVGLDKLFRVLA